MRFMIALSLLFFSSFSHADDVFAPCVKLPTPYAQLQCQDDIIDGLIERYFGKPELERARSEATTSCASTSGSVRLDPSVRRLASMDCKLQAKIKFYNEHP